MNEKNFTVIEDWMFSLGLGPNELIIFATIYSFSKNDGTAFTGRLEYFAERFHITRRTIGRIIVKLLNKKLIIKEKGVLSGAYSCCSSYRVNSDIISPYLCQNNTQECQNVTTECQNVTPEVTNCHSSQCQNVIAGVSNCLPSQCQNVQPGMSNCLPSQCQNVQAIYNKLYNKEYSKEDNKLYNTLSPNGDCESDYESNIVENEISISDVNNADNTVNAEGNKKSAGTKKKTGTKSKKEQDAGITARFEKFWAAYPRHIDKAKALKAFTKINPSDELLEQMLSTINEAKKTTQWQTQQYIPYPTTWLNGSRWEDEIDPKDIDKDIAHTLDNPIDRAVLNGEDPYALWDW